MNMRSFCAGLYWFFTLPFRMILNCFRREEKPVAPKVRIEFKTDMERQFRPSRRKKNEPNETQGIVHYRALFLADHFSALSDSKNDVEFKDAREQARKKAERIKYRKKIMDKLDKEKEKEKDIAHPEKPRTPSPDSD